MAMPTHRPHLLALAPVALAAMIAAAPRLASACGGTFCDAGPQVMPVDQTGENILFVMEEGAVEAHVQIQYEGDPAEFAWIVPLPAAAGTGLEISVGSEELFQRMLAVTVPTFTLDTSFEGDCGGGGGGLGCAATEDAAFGIQGLDEEPQDPGEPTVLSHEVVGAYEYAVLQGGTADGVGQWLDDNGYARDDDAPEILQAYLDEGFVFVAFKLRPGTALDQLHPVVLRYPGTEPCIPLRLTRIAAVEDMRIRAFFLGDARVVPTNYRHVEINPLRIDWLDVGSNYYLLVREAVDQEGADGRAFVTEYAGGSSVVPPTGLRGFAWDSEAFLTVSSSELSGTLQAQGLFGCGLGVDEQGFPIDGCGPLHPLVLGLLRTYLPPPPDVDALEFYQCSECFAELVDGVRWDRTGFAAAFEEQIVLPAEHALDVLSENPYLTRLFTMVSPGEMTTDPLFHERRDLPEVTNQWTATQVFHCEDNDRLELASGQRIYLDDGGQRPVFEGMSAAVRIQEFPLSGAPMTLLDTTDDDAARLSAWNETLNPSSSCECRIESRTQGAGWLGLLLLLGARARSRQRSTSSRARSRQRSTNS